MAFLLYFLLLHVVEAGNKEKVIREVDCQPRSIRTVPIGITGKLLACTGWPKDAVVRRVYVWHSIGPSSNERQRLFSYNPSRGFPKATSNMPELVSRLSVGYNAISAKMTVSLEDARQGDTGVYGCTFVSSGVKCSMLAEVKEIDIRCFSEGGLNYPLGATAIVECSFVPEREDVDTITCWYKSPGEFSQVNLISYTRMSVKTYIHADRPDLSSRVSLLYDRASSSLRLTLENMKATDSGTYGCSVYSRTNKRKGQVNIQFQNLDVKSVRFKGEQIHGVDLQGQATFSCFYTPPEANILRVHWYKLGKDGKQVMFTYIPDTEEGAEGPMYQNRVDHMFAPKSGRTTLIIKHSKREDLGRYQCQIVSQGKGVTADATLHQRGVRHMDGRFEVCILPEPVSGNDSANVCRELCDKSSLPDQSSREQDSLLRRVMSEKDIKTSWVTMGKWRRPRDKQLCYYVMNEGNDISIERTYHAAGIQIVCKYPPYKIPTYVKWLRTFGRHKVVINEFRIRQKESGLLYSQDPEEGVTSLVLRTTEIPYVGLYMCEIGRRKYKMRAPGPLAVEEILDYHGMEVIVLPNMVKGSQAGISCSQNGLFREPETDHTNILKYIFSRFDISSVWVACVEDDYHHDSSDLCCLAEMERIDINIINVSCEDFSYVVCIGNPGNYGGTHVFSGKRHFQKATDMCGKLGADYQVIDREWTGALERLYVTILQDGWSAWVTDGSKSKQIQTNPIRQQ